MDFSVWSPSHTLLIAITVIVTMGGLIRRFAVLFYRTRLLEQKMEQLDDRMDKRIEKQDKTFFQAMEHLEGRIDKRIDDVRKCQRFGLN